MKLSSCPFCEGPPVPVRVRGVGGGEFPDEEMAGPGGLYAEAFVFCHECGAQGPSVDDIVHDRAGCNALERQAIDLWQLRDGRHRDLYDRPTLGATE
ncbi:Lar family restriction alleviation protein [Robbsia sp. KACC 23696]|uniref:Lar family restriction alleviation protein n=1 Tax=Robbsia sp. KACC 23696 TaxID=3149231 RepID=UPI00325A5B28